MWPIASLNNLNAVSKALLISAIMLYNSIHSSKNNDLWAHRLHVVLQIFKLKGQADTL